MMGPQKPNFSLGGHRKGARTQASQVPRLAPRCTAIAAVVAAIVVRPGQVCL